MAERRKSSERPHKKQRSSGASSKGGKFLRDKKVDIAHEAQFDELSSISPRNQEYLENLPRAGAGQADLSPEEILAIRGRRYYDRWLRTQLEQEAWGKYVLINAKTGEYVVGETLAEATAAFEKKFPGVKSFGLQVGEPIRV